MTGTGEYAVQLRAVWLRLGREAVLRGIDLDIPQGEHVTLLGPNGAGKTSLLRLLASALRPARGEGRILGYDLRDAAAVREQIHLMPVDAALYPDLTCRENLEFALRMHSRPLSGVSEALARVHLTDAEDRRTRFLSAGMRRRLALARAWVLARPLTLVDEPFANLDTAGRELVLELLGDLTTRGTTLIIAAHEPELAARLAPRQLHVAAGQLREVREAAR
ncbi:heme ABC exporter ATP-binding protein CcmA [Deinococcus piscis]|uniref:Heme ABC exporter ATP-binding protein CcmA n=1 Tax=Deinococcus piscis TaxID=394230 RepID=A0ABQ3K2A5_9DEIO|nr:heme ABC exporter ATP-binding protein CcmA [Deinococcus piscis]GHF99966.1 heme ABC exporter ATP-binding protein CcmA [Deinococcus piscis]